MDSRELTYKVTKLCVLSLTAVIISVIVGSFSLHMAGLLRSGTVPQKVHVQVSTS